MAYYGAYIDPRQEPHFLESCALCSKPLGSDSDIFMYRGNTPFCSSECRQEQIDMDEAKERKSWKLSSSRSIRKSETKDSSSNKTVRKDTVAVA